jgi:protein OS-9
MTTNDMIYMVKEMAICQYVIIIHSPHLCSLPGFKADLKLDVEPAPIRCRQVLRDDDFERWANGDEQGHGGWAPKMEVPLRTVGHGSGSGSGDERASLRELLAKIGDKEEVRQGNEAAGEDVGGGQGQGDHDDDDHVPLDGEEIVFISLEDLAEGDEGPVVIDADFLAGGEGLRDRLGAADRQMILGLVKEYLERKSGGDRPDATSDGDGESDGKEDKRKRDEL